ncbi:MAG: immunity 22 family protein [Planctomycetota bacterium]
MSEFDNVDVWIGKAETTDRIQELLAEIDDFHEVEDKPISEFAVTQNVIFYDHDFVGCETVSELVAPADVLGSAFSDSFRDRVRLAAKENGIENANAILFVWGQAISEPLDIDVRGCIMHYVGTLDFRDGWNR